MARQEDSLEMSTFPPRGSSLPHLPYDATNLDDDDDWGDSGSHSYAARGLVSPGVPGYPAHGVLGEFLLTKPLGWSILVGALGLCLTGCEIALTVVNRTIIWCVYLKGNYTSYTRFLYMIMGVFGFPYPLITTLLELIICHFVLLSLAFSTRCTSQYLREAGLSILIAPSRPGDSRFGIWNRIRSFLQGIAGGGFLEFHPYLAKQVFALAVVYVAHLWLSTFLFTYSHFASYNIARIGTAPVALFLASVMGGKPHSEPFKITVFIATIALLFALQLKYVEFIWKTIPAGIASSILAAIYPILIIRTSKLLNTSSVSEASVSSPKLNPQQSCTNRLEAEADSQAVWQLFHYTSLLSIIMFIPIVLVSGEVSIFWQNHSDLDSLFYWTMLLLGGLGRGIMFAGTILFTKATSPMTAAFWSMFPIALSLAIMMGKRLFAENWVALAIYWTSCGWYIVWRFVENLT